MASGKRDMKWDAVNDRKLFLGVLKVHGIKCNYEELAKFMSTEDCKPTGLAIQKRITKLKKMAESDSTGEDDGEGTPKATKTPRKRSAASSSSSPRKKSKPTKAGSGDDDGEVSPAAVDDGAGSGVKEEAGGDDEWA